ncbi:hypothetical protein AB4090_14295 [Acidithiobacillus sp. IBUN Pt1247-S3]|uniref:hypothetical protein n=1 Tax=Acidithiobacillus sp. IBUN Pt1247-S3 TaxID=3166642 RepID=UPI0034E3BB6E
MLIYHLYFHLLEKPASSSFQVFADVQGFAQRYVQDWNTWLAATPSTRPDLFGRILRKWQATRPNSMRRLKDQASHAPPFLDDLLMSAGEPIATLEDLDVRAIRDRSTDQEKALCDLWRIFEQLPTTGTASCVGITKAVLLLTDGKLGPAFDSQVRKKLRVGQPASCTAWISALEAIADDIASFEDTHHIPLTKAVPDAFASLAYGRLYDMALGPR